jgi:hypothetical protein
MARWAANNPPITPVGVADTTNFTDTGYLGLQGGSGTQRINVLEVTLGGLATSSAPTPIVVARDSTIGVTLSVGRFAALDAASAALAAPPVAFNTATTKPQRSATLSLMWLAFNAFGGIFRWVAAPGEELGMLGNTASLGEMSFSCYTGGTPGLSTVSAICEPF